MSRRGAVLALELRVQWRYRIPAAALVLTLVWTLVLLAMPAALARGAGPVILTIDTATFGSFFIAALVLFERGEGALAALLASPLRVGEYLGAKIAILTGLSVASAIPLALASGRGHANVGLVLLGVGLLAALFLVLNFALVVRHRSLTGFLTVAPLPLVPLIAAPLAHLTGIAEHPLLFVVPTTGAADLIRAGINPATPLSPGRTAAVLGYLVLAIMAATLAARRVFDHEYVRPKRVRPPRERRRRTRSRPASWLAALVHIDVRTTLRSALLVLVLTGPILLAIALRLGYTPLADYLHARFEFDLTQYQPVLLASLVVLHVPLITGMVGALLILDDIDDRTVLILRVSPVTLPRYLAYRTISAGAAAVVTLAVAVPVSGLVPWPTLPALLPALVLAAAQAPLITLATAAFAGNKVEGLAWLKILGLLPTAIAPAVWWLSDPARWPLRTLPYYWTVDSLWHPALPGLLTGAALTTVATVLLARRTLTASAAAEACQSYRGVVGAEVLYDDGRVVLDREGITLRRYYFPLGTSKRIPYQRIQRVRARPMGWLTGQGRGWGSAHPGYWLPLDASRPRKDTLVVLDLGGHVKPAFTPDNPAQVLDILARHTRT